MKIFFYLFMVVNILVAQNISYDTALKIPSVKEFEGQIGENVASYLNKAIKNTHWNNANKYFLGKTVNSRTGKKKYKTLPYNYIMDELKKASNDGVMLAMFQGYRYSSIVTGRQGKFAKRDLAWFASKLMEQNKCVGYIDAAYGYSRGWYKDDRVDWKKANRIIKAGKFQCKNKKINKSIRDTYEKYSIQFKAMSKRVR